MTLKLSIIITFIYPMHNEITDDTGKVISLAEVSDIILCWWS
jgi:hypothetical protein